MIMRTMLVKKDPFYIAKSLLYIAVRSDRPPYLSMDFQWSFPRKATKQS